MDLVLVLQIMKQASWLKKRRSLQEAGELSQDMQISSSPMTERLDPDSLSN